MLKKTVCDSSAGGETVAATVGSQDADWTLHVDTELVTSDWEASLRGGRGAHPPRPLAAPIFASSTYRLESAKEGEELSNTLAEDGYIYSRWGNPTVDAAASVIAGLEGAAGTLLFASGMSSIVTTLFTFLRAGDHTVICRPCYGGVNAFVEEYLCHLGVEVTWIPTSDVQAYRDAVRETTKLLYIESPANPTMSVVDIEALATFARTVPNLSPMDAFLLHRSLKTLGLRMERHSDNALAVAEFLEKHPKVARVYYPGLPSHPNHEVAKKLMKHFSGMISFELKGGKENGIRMVESVRVIVLAVSLGGVESLIEHPASMTHCDSYVSPEVKKASGITDRLIRLRTTTNTGLVWCPWCGNRSLYRVAVVLDGTGSMQYRVLSNKQFSHRGLRHSLPAPKSGRHAHNPILTPDQQVTYRERRRRENKVDPLELDYVARSSPFSVHDVTSRGARLAMSAGGRGGGGYQRRNPNAVRPKGQRKK